MIKKHHIYIPLWGDEHRIFLYTMIHMLLYVLLRIVLIMKKKNHIRVRCKIVK